MKTVIVTGGTKGIGLAICKKLLSEGYQVIATGRTPAEQDTIDDPNITYHALELTSEQSVQDFCRTIAELPSLYGLVNNAGINIIESYAEISDQHFEKVIGVNLKASFLLSREVVRKLQALESHGRIVHLGSIWSVISKSGRASYSASKSALHGMTRAMSAELASQGILVNMVSPGFVNTELTARSLSDEEAKALADQVPINRMAEPSEIAEVIEFLLSKRNSYISGQNIVVDGGFSHV
jgi:NAD(P)-dependent dehydrogenase (short-subunit alcohol dehydrogenase family)